MKVVLSGQELADVIAVHAARTLGHAGKVIDAKIELVADGNGIRAEVEIAASVEAKKEGP